MFVGILGLFQFFDPASTIASFQVKQLTVTLGVVDGLVSCISFAGGMLFLLTKDASPGTGAEGCYQGTAQGNGRDVSGHEAYLLRAQLRAS